MLETVQQGGIYYHVYTTLTALFGLGTQIFTVCIFEKFKVWGNNTKSSFFSSKTMGTSLKLQYKGLFYQRAVQINMTALPPAQSAPITCSCEWTHPLTNMNFLRIRQQKTVLKKELEHSAQPWNKWQQSDKQKREGKTMVCLWDNEEKRARNI